MLCCIHLCQEESWVSFVFRDRRVDRLLRMWAINDGKLGDAVGIPHQDVP